MDQLHSVCEDEETIPEESELELSCALHKLTRQVQKFENQMRTVEPHGALEHVEEEGILEEIEGLQLETSNNHKSTPQPNKDYDDHWNVNEKQQELHDMKSHIASLLTGIQHQANKLDKKLVKSATKKSKKRTAKETPSNN